MDIHYQVVDLTDVMDYFSKSFEFQDGQIIFKTEHFVDTAKGKVVFKIWTRDGS